MMSGQPGGLPRAGGSIPGRSDPAFSLLSEPSSPVPLLIAVPHAGRSYPDEITRRMRNPRYSAVRLEDRHIDLVAQGVADATGAALLVAHAPRAMIDLNRAPDDVDWTMIAGGAPAGARNQAANRRAQSGLGLVPRRLPGLGEIWAGRTDRRELDERVALIHAPYHAALAQALDHLRARWGAALLIDLHSMPPIQAVRPGHAAVEFVVGDRFGASCDGALVSTVFSWLEANGRNAAHNRPYAGGYVLDRHAAPGRGIHAIQLEVCRTSYLDAALAEPTARVAGLVRLLAGLVRTLSAEVAAIGSAHLPLLAAE